MDDITFTQTYFWEMNMTFFSSIEKFSEEKFVKAVAFAEALVR